MFKFRYGVTARISLYAGIASERVRRDYNICDNIYVLCIENE